MVGLLSGVLLAAWCSVQVLGYQPVVETTYGQVRGYTMNSLKANQFFAFQGIPYAKPPVGELRFQAPEPPLAWEGIREATTPGPQCIQTSTSLIGVEDCLYLTVYSPNVTGNAPVLVHFHGGAFLSGDEAGYGPEYLIDENIVVVKVNYRLGIYGFLTFETPDLPGNQGMKDQAMALKWVQANIARFGGNPNLVTIIGESAGGASVYNHIISPLSKGLFHRAISESGTSYSQWALAPPGYRRRITEKLMTLLNCPVTPKEAIPCVSKKEPAEVVSKLGSFSEGWVHLPLHFGPVIEAPGPNSFIVGLPHEWDHTPVPLFIGTTSAEGLMETITYLAKNFDFKWFSKNFNEMAPLIYIYNASASDPAKITEELRRYYLPHEEITIDDFVNLTMAYTDSAFAVSILDGANKHKGDVYFYYYDYRLPLPPDVDEKYNIGANHCQESMLLWNYGTPLIYPRDEKIAKLSDKFIHILGNFMRTGVPTIEGSGPIWKKWTPEENHYILIDSEGFHLKKGLMEDRYQFWKSLKFRDNYGE
uniref:Carboxylic ester hydrolase n=1 Tax=Riptortus pedestris TaxID=329032 RepID=R4WPU6_RIPPE|nr:hypothetical protein [Riptortus pedestris]